MKQYCQGNQTWLLNDVNSTPTMFALDFFLKWARIPWKDDSKLTIASAAVPFSPQCMRWQVFALFRELFNGLNVFFLKTTAIHAVDANYLPHTFTPWTTMTNAFWRRKRRPSLHWTGPKSTAYTFAAEPVNLRFSSEAPALKCVRHASRERKAA